MANEVRGEFAIELDGAPHTMRPSWEAILAFETATGKSVIELARAASEGRLTTREMATVVAECVREYGRQTTEEGVKRQHLGVNDGSVARCIVALGPLIALRAVSPMLIMAATGGVESTGEAKPVPVDPKGDAGTGA